MWTIFAVFVIALLVGCAIVLGPGTASVNTKADTKREVTPEATTIEDVLVNKDKKQ